MHPEIRQVGPGSCPKCGMALEPVDVEQEDDDSELRDMQRRLWVAAVLTAPLFLYAMAEMAFSSLRKHALAVEAAVRGYARTQGANEEEWAVVALLHDFDYERYPTLGDHPNKGCEHLRSLGYPEWVMRAILSHASEITGVQPETPLEKALVACDDLAGFVTAAALVRPTKSVLDLEAKSVIKRMKDKAFARQVPRDHLIRGAELMGLPLEEHVTNVIGFMRLEADALGLRGTL